MLQALTLLPILDAEMGADKYQQATEFIINVVLGTFTLLVTFLLLPAVRRSSAGTEPPSPLPAARWPCCARRPASPPEEYCPPASHNTARWGPAAARH